MKRKTTQGKKQLKKAPRKMKDLNVRATKGGSVKGGRPIIEGESIPKDHKDW